MSEASQFVQMIVTGFAVAAALTTFALIARSR